MDETDSPSAKAPSKKVVEWEEKLKEKENDILRERQRVEEIRKKAQQRLSTKKLPPLGIMRTFPESPSPNSPRKQIKESDDECGAPETSSDSHSEANGLSEETTSFLMDQISSLKEKIKRLESELQSAKDDARIEYKADESELEQRLRKSEEKLENKKRKTKSLKEDLDYKSQMLDNFHNNVRQMQTLNLNLSQQIEDEKKRTSEQKERGDKWKKKSKELEEKLGKEERKMKKLKNQLKERNARIEELAAMKTISSHTKKKGPSHTQTLQDLPSWVSQVKPKESSPGKLKSNVSVDKKQRGSRESYESDSGVSIVKNITVTSSSETLRLTTTVSANWTIAEVLPRIRTKFPGDTTGFMLYCKVGKTTYMMLEPEKKLSYYASRVKQLEPHKVELEFENPSTFRGKDSRHLKKISTKEGTPQYNDGLMEYVTSGNLDGVKAVISKEQIIALENDGCLPLNDAIPLQNYPLIEFLLAFYEKHAININARDKNGWTAFHCAATYCVRTEKDEEIIKKLLNFPGIQVDVLNSDLNTPLHFFVKNFELLSCQEIGEQIINKAPIIVNSPNRNGETPLHKAIFNGNVRTFMVKLLLQHGANVNLANGIGETALHYSVSVNRKDLVKLLLYKGGDINLREKRQNKTPLDLAKERQQTDIVEIITQVEELRDWLKKEKLEEYFSLFVKADQSLTSLASLEENRMDSFFSKINVNTFGVRIRIMNAVQSLRESSRQKSFEKRLSKVEKSRSSSSGPTSEQLERIERFKQGMTDEESVWLLRSKDLEFTEELGSGATGKVYKGLFNGETLNGSGHKSGIKVAIKVLKNVNDESLELFKKEFLVMSSTNSPNVIHFFGAILEPQLCMVIEYCPRGSLYSVLNNSDIEVTWDMGIRFALDMARGVSYLHSMKPYPVFHRDLKSMNLLVAKDWTVKVCDMGLARMNNRQNEQSMAKLCGTYAYLAPEIFFGESYRAASDVFSMAIVLWEIAVRVIYRSYRIPYTEYDDLQADYQVAIRVAEQGRRPTLPRNCPPPWEQLMRNCWEHSVDSRPSTDQIVTTLETIQKDFESEKEKWSSTILEERETEL